VTRVLDIKDLSTHIRLSKSTVQAVGNVDLYIDEGETLGLVGESGCGKSITGLSIMGLLPPGGSIVGGSILLEGRDLVGLPEEEMRKIRGNDVAMIFQDSSSSLNPTKNIGDQVMEPVMLHRGASKKEAYDRAIEVLELVGIPQAKERMEDYPHQLSGGLRQRVMIAIALTCDPKVLIADEPTTALDVTIQAQILRLLDDLKSKFGMSILLVTHDMGVVAGRADRVNVMYAGRMVEATTTERLFDEMRHPYTQALLASIPKMDQDNSRALFSIPGLPPDLTHPPQGCRFRARCAYAQDDCAESEPKLVGDSLHVAACFHPVVGGPLREDQMLTLKHAASYHGVGSSDEEPLLKVVDLKKEFPVTSGAILRRKVGSVHAVSGVSLEVRRGEIFGLVGESGCGKSTLGRVIVGLERPDSGQVLLDGQDVYAKRGKELVKLRKNLQMMFQDPYGSLDPRMRVASILREPLAIHKIGTRKEQEQRSIELMGEVGLPKTALERFAHEFSGGQRQRIGLARALTLNPKVIVADEPVSALDVSIRSQVLNLMKRLQGVHDMAYLVISHDLAVVKYLADRIGVMYLGKIVEVASGEDLYANPAHPYTDGLIKTIPLPDPRGERSKKDVGIKGELPSPIHPPSGCRFRTRCPRAQELCAQEEPVMRDFGVGHTAACHFPLIEPVQLLASKGSTQSS
jgi:oligopeptide/dipeptide ABC transporter ATP-binding protein